MRQEALGNDDGNFAGRLAALAFNRRRCCCDADTAAGAGRSSNALHVSCGGGTSHRVHISVRREGQAAARLLRDEMGGAAWILVHCTCSSRRSLAYIPDAPPPTHRLICVIPKPLPPTFSSLLLNNRTTFFTMYLE